MNHQLILPFNSSTSKQFKIQCLQCYMHCTRGPVYTWTNTFRKGQGDQNFYQIWSPQTIFYVQPNIFVMLDALDDIPIGSAAAGQQKVEHLKWCQSCNIIYIVNLILCWWYGTMFHVTTVSGVLALYIVIFDGVKFFFCFFFPERKLNWQSKWVLTLPLAIPKHSFLLYKDYVITIYCVVWWYHTATETTK